MNKKIKYLYRILLICAVFITCTACNAKKNNEESSGDFYQYQPYWNNDSFVTRSETGYYLTSDISGLSYLDNKSKELTLLCGDSTCTHTTKDCSANKDMEPYTIRYSGDKLYYIGSPSIGTVSLSRSDKDGTNEEVLGDLFTMASKTQVSIHFEVHQGYGYYAVALNEAEDGPEVNFRLYRIKLEKNATPELIYEEEKEVLAHHIYKISAEDSKIYFITTSYYMESNEEIKLLSYDTQTEEIDIVLDNISKHYTIWEGNIYFYTSENSTYSLKKYNISSEKIEVMISNMPEERCGELSSDGRYLYSYPSFDSEGNSIGTNKIWIYDFTGKEVTEIDLGEMNVDRVFFGDTQYLFVYRSTVEGRQVLMLYDKTQIGSGKNDFLSYSFSDLKQ